MFALINEKGKRGSTSVEVLIDTTKVDFLKNKELELTYTPMYCYAIESLATSVREYKTLRLSEFYKFN